ncbi:MAG TPA: hypothetical protein ENJ35_09035 [Gammaproteobacteria bacterium]|nr:hypothetical protein [Gammaproteobacteria bacterium]
MDTEIGQLLLTADTMQKKLGHIVRDVRCGSDKITSISTKISRNNHSLATRTEEQANSLETTSSSMEEIASAARQNADNATSANKLAQTMIKQADAGDHSIIATIDAVEDISNRSQQIEDIVGMIDEIAFQTNLLALNASVEAARAGEQGKGFSVVAGEVRNLAERSAKAANEVKTLIADTRETVGRGVSLASASGEALTAIIESVHQVSNLIQEITTASSEQAAGINEINSALSQIDSTTQENSALVEETASASAELVNQAKSLQQLMGYFKLPEPSAMHSTRPPLRPSQRRGKPNRADAA